MPSKSDNSGNRPPIRTPFQGSRGLVTKGQKRGQPKPKPESTEGMRGGWLRKGREAWVMVQCPDAAGFERVRVETGMPGGC